MYEVEVMFLRIKKLSFAIMENWRLLDPLFYKCYNLTTEKIKIIEDSVK